MALKALNRLRSIPIYFFAGAKPGLKKAVYPRVPKTGNPDIRSSASMLLK
jgi:hypothetical protein